MISRFQRLISNQQLVPLHNGASGVLAGASVVFFSFVGFDTVATCAEEVKNPGRDLPIGIMVGRLLMQLNKLMNSVIQFTLS